MKLRCFVVALCVGVGAMAGKYSRDVNEPEPRGDGQPVEFRIAKLNQVWEKAKRVGARARSLRVSEETAADVNVIYINKSIIKYTALIYAG